MHKENSFHQLTTQFNKSKKEFGRMTSLPADERNSWMNVNRAHARAGSSAVTVIGLNRIVTHPYTSPAEQGLTLVIKQHETRFFPCGKVSDN